MTTAVASRRKTPPCAVEVLPKAAPGTPLRVLDLGLMDYAASVRLQEELVDQRLRDEIPETLLLLEHPPVITLGRRAPLDDVYASPDMLRQHGVQLYRSSRGGLVTYHGPGQVVGYPIVRLRSLNRTIPEYVCGLQRAIIAALARIGVAAHSDPDHVGVWTSAGKIGAIGIAQRHGVAYHGFAINLQPDLAHFQLINPCGIGDRGVTSAAHLLGCPVDVALFKQLAADELRRELGVNSGD